MSLKQLIACIFFIAGVNAILISIAYDMNDNAISYGYEHNGKNIRYTVADSFAEWCVRDHSAFYLFMIGIDTIILVIWCCVCHSNNKFESLINEWMI